MLTDGKCKKGDLNFIRDTYLNGNVDLTVFMLTRLNLLYSDKDAEEFATLRTQYEQKIDEYLERLKNIEESAAQKKSSDEVGDVRTEER